MSSLLMCTMQGLCGVCWGGRCSAAEGASTLTRTHAGKASTWLSNILFRLCSAAQAIVLHDAVAGDALEIAPYLRASDLQCDTDGSASTRLVNILFTLYSAARAIVLHDAVTGNSVSHDSSLA